MFFDRLIWCVMDIWCSGVSGVVSSNVLFDGFMFSCDVYYGGGGFVFVVRFGDDGFEEFS